MLVTETSHDGQYYVAHNKSYDQVGTGSNFDVEFDKHNLYTNPAMVISNFS